MSTLLRESLAGSKAPKLPRTESGAWINSNPFTLEEKRGSIVLVDFWTFSCINCLRTLPHIIRWHQLYANLGLIILGIHSPEFEFEKERNNVEAFVKRNSIKYPVVLDNDFSIWRVFSNHFWPRKLIVNPEGRIVYDHIGEGGYAETEKMIRDELYELHPGIIFETDIETGQGEGGFCYPSTPELYCGYERGSLGNAKSLKGETFDYEDPLIRQENQLYLSGKWTWQSEYLRFEGGSGYLEIIFRGLEVNAVMSSEGEPIKVSVSIGDKPMEETISGRDISRDGNQSIDVSNSRMYNIIASKEFVTRKVRLTPLKKGFRIYAFTFGGCPAEVGVPDIVP